MPKPRSARAIFDQTNKLARQFYAMAGYQVPKGYNFYAATHPHEKLCWLQASAAQLELTKTDMRDVLDEMEDDPTQP